MKILKAVNFVIYILKNTERGISMDSKDFAFNFKNSENNMILSQQKDIYRGIPKKFENSPLTVSAMRKNELSFLENCYIKLFSKESLEEYRSKILVSTTIPFFANVSNLAAWSCFLSTINIIIEIQKNPSIFSPLQHESVYTVFENLTLIETKDLPKSIYILIKNIFTNFECNDYSFLQEISYTNVSCLVFGFEYFQHLNYNLRGNLDYNPFPTMVMDWTEDISVANDFSFYNNEPGIIISINYEKYKLLIANTWYPLLIAADIASLLPGFTPYFDYHFLFSKTNKNMQQQKGIVLFWPWEYTVDELLTNNLGKILEFKKIHIF